MTISFTDAIPITTPADPYATYVGRVFRIDEVTWGNEKQNFLVRYRGRLLTDSEAAYEQLTASLKPLDVTPLFREESPTQSILLVKGVVHPRASNPWINLILFIFTVFSVLISGTVTHYTGPISSDIGVISPHLSKALLEGRAWGLS